MSLDDFLHRLGPDSCVDVSALARGLYSTDASLYRVVPGAVATPRTVDELLEVIDAARETGVPITARGAGTSCAGNAVGPGVVIDMRRHLNAIRHIDPDARTAVVEPGVVQETLQSAVRQYGLRFGPDPSTSTRCTIGGIIGNNACGPRALGYGTGAANLVDADVVLGTGERVSLGTYAPAELFDLVDSHLGVIRTQFGRFSRQVSGYSLEHLLPEKGRNVPRFFAGSEGTLGIATGLTVRLVEDPAHTLTLALGYPSMADAADAVTSVLPYTPVAVEGMDSRLVEIVRLGGGFVPDLPRGEGWMFIELAGDDEKELVSRGNALIASAGALEGWVVEDKVLAARLWSLRSDGAGLAGVSLEKPAYPGWEDAAVPPERLGAYLRDFEALLEQYGFHSLPYGHFGEGCVHARIDFPLTSKGGAARYREFVTECARLVASYGGSLSGEHGDGRARSELLPLMYSAEALGLFGAVKHIFDPKNLLNPGVLVDPAPVDEAIRYSGVIDSPLAKAHPHFSAQVHRCTGVGKCVAAHPVGVMCPSYQATREEKDSTRGRARILQEMVNGSLIHGWDSPEVEAALDLCLGCKGCATDCPTGVDMASAKSYVLSQRYRKKVRPTSHYVLGWLPRWGRLVSALHLGPLANSLLGAPGVGALAKRVAGVDPRRPLPKFSFGSARASGSRLVSSGGGPGSGRRTTVRTGSNAHVRAKGSVPDRGPVAIWVDSFTDSFQSTALPALVKVLLAAGYTPTVITETACCGLTWITTGQRDAAARQIRHALEVLAPIAERGTPIVGMEPSCIAVWRSDASELLDDPRVASVSGAIRTLAELLGQSDWRPPDLAGHEIVAQPHCHHASVLGWEADAALLGRMGAKVTTLGGCCGLAGNFGVEQGHYETSLAVAENELLPALRANPHAIVLADGFSCRKQVSDLTRRQAMTMAELIAAHL